MPLAASNTGEPIAGNIVKENEMLADSIGPAQVGADTGSRSQMRMPLIGTARRHGSADAWTCAHATPPSGEPIMLTKKTLPFGNRREGCEHWRDVKIGQADRRSSNPGRLSH